MWWHLVWCGVTWCGVVWWCVMWCDDMWCGVMRCSGGDDDDDAVLPCQPIWMSRLLLYRVGEALQELGVRCGEERCLQRHPEPYRQREGRSSGRQVSQSRLLCSLAQQTHRCSDLNLTCTLENSQTVWPAYPSYFPFLFRSLNFYLSLWLM